MCLVKRVTPTLKSLHARYFFHIVFIHVGAAMVKWIDHSLRSCKLGVAGSIPPVV